MHAVRPPVLSDNPGSVLHVTTDGGNGVDQQIQLLTIYHQGDGLEGLKTLWGDPPDPSP